MQIVGKLNPPGQFNINPGLPKQEMQSLNPFEIYASNSTYLQSCRHCFKKPIVLFRLLLRSLVRHKLGPLNPLCYDENVV